MTSIAFIVSENYFEVDALADFFYFSGPSLVQASSYHIRVIQNVSVFFHLAYDGINDTTTRSNNYI